MLEPERVVSPGFADVFVGSEVAEGLEPLREVVSVYEGCEVISEPPVCDVVISMHGGLRVRFMRSTWPSVHG